eukprot:TRINITY_DN13683_c0_g1_i1.p1 TRINITY_DN13683_c0_g1~~TRINITY_DN13683_c0_g1_i1.p1  ORF type:complete len:648 (+),score=92.61 TRINITY_DN13683_c0_g1_i1:56-1999(+)
MAAAAYPERFGNYLRGDELGRGAYGVVFRCSKSGSDEPYAAKAVDLRRLQLSISPDRETKKLQREVDILKRLPPHENLVRFVDAVEDGHWFIFILEFVRGGDLFNALTRRPVGPKKRPCFAEEEVVFILRQLVEGLQFLHDHQVIHRDLKLENILVTQEVIEGSRVFCDVKISDFGLSKVVGEELSEACTAVGSPRYVAPEVLGKGIHDFRADLWSLGILVHVLLTGCYPVDDPPRARQASLTAAVNKMGVSPGAQEVVLELLQTDRNLRISLQRLKQRPWFSGHETKTVGTCLANEDESLGARMSTKSLFGSSLKSELNDTGPKPVSDAQLSHDPTSTPPSKRAKTSTTALRQTRLFAAGSTLKPGLQEPAETYTIPKPDSVGQLPPGPASIRTCKLTSMLVTPVHQSTLCPAVRLAEHVDVDTDPKVSIASQFASIPNGTPAKTLASSRRSQLFASSLKPDLETEAECDSDLKTGADAQFPCHPADTQSQYIKTSAVPRHQTKLFAALTAGAAPNGYERPELPPTMRPKEKVCVSVKDLDDSGSDHPIEATVRFRSDHKTGSSFHLRVGDCTGDIDIKFWDEAAKGLKTDSSLRKGAVVRFSGFKVVPLKPKDKTFAPQGRRHCLSYSSICDVKFTVLVSATQTA